MKKIVGIVVVLCLMVSMFAACGSSKETKPDQSSANATAEKKEAAKKQIIIKFANYFPEAHPQNVALKEVFKPMVEKESNGDIKVEIYPNNQLGAEKEFSEGTMMGTVEMSLMGQLMADRYPRLMLCEFPYIFDDLDKGFKLLNSEVGAEITDGMIKDGIRPLAWDVNGVRAVSNSKKPINTIADCKDIKLRVPQSPQFIETAKALGFSAVTMPISEVFTALQQKVVDGQENPPTTVLTSGWAEVQKYIALTNHIISYNMISINEKFYQSLTDDQKKIVEKAAKALAEKELELYKKAAAADIETLKSKGIQFTSPDLKPFREACVAAHENMLKNKPQIKGTYDKIIAKQKEMK